MIKKDVTNLITAYCNTLKELLIIKNHDYGDSVFEAPMFANNVSTAEAILVRIGDKVNRLKNLLKKGSTAYNESVSDTEMDLAGYLILLQVAKELSQEPKTTNDEGGE